MTIRTLSRLSLPLVLVAGAGLALASAPAPTPNDVIEQSMGRMNKALKTLGQGISAETRAAALVELDAFQAAVLAAKKEVPDTAAALPEAERGAFADQFRSQLAMALKVACEAEIAVLEGDYDSAALVLKEELGRLKSEGHDRFKGD